MPDNLVFAGAITADKSQMIHHKIIGLY